jgi:succinate dehydrogenase/fumarate reductase flavoprotein subunit
MSTEKQELQLSADVLVIGGGPAATWAAWSATQQGARVILVDKGFCGSSGATAPSGTGVWVVPPVKEAREQAKAQRETLGGHLADHAWMDRVLDQTWTNIQHVGEWGYPFARDENGRPANRGVQGPEYMRLMRKVVKQAGVIILDQSPAIELLLDNEGAVAGAAGVQRQENRRWTVRAGAVVIATGGCAFLSKALGCNTNTGDGYLMTAEAGGELSGMEFSSHYSLSTSYGSVTKGAHFSYATFFDEKGEEIDGAIKNGYRSTSTIARALLHGRVYAQLDKARDRPDVQRMLRLAQPNFFLPLDRVGIDPFTQKFPVTLILEGTVRGTGGIRIVDTNCATTVPGLYAAGDAATRELICGGFTGGGSHNAAWALSSGTWAGEGAAKHAIGLGAHASTREVRPIGRAGVRASVATSATFSSDAVIRGVQDEVLPTDKNLFRSESGLRSSLVKLQTLWNEVQREPSGRDVQAAQRSREAAALTATARWAYTSGLQRTESRGMHRRVDHPSLDPRQREYLITGGLDKIWVRRESAPPLPGNSVERELEAVR